MKTTTLVSLCALLLAGCATAPDDVVECRSADWEKVGRRDGGSGHSSQLQAHAAACAPHGVKPDEAAYARGLETGRAQYANTMSQRRMSLF